MDKSIIPECYADTLFVETLVRPKKGYNHQHSCFKVESTLKQIDGFGVGIIDKDKKQIKYLEEFILIDQIEGSLSLWKHKDEGKHHYFIQIQPAIEGFIVDICQKEKIEQGTIVNSIEDLKKVTKTQIGLKNTDLIELFGKISSLDENECVRKLKGWISLLLDKNYQVDINELKNV